MQKTKIRQNKRDEAVAIVAQALNKSKPYVRAVIADTKHIKYKGNKPNAIRKAYCYYLNTIKPKTIVTLKQYSDTIPAA